MSTDNNNSEQKYEYCECSHPDYKGTWCEQHCGKPKHPTNGVITHVTQHPNGLFTWDIAEEPSHTTYRIHMDMQPRLYQPKLTMMQGRIDNIKIDFDKDQNNIDDE